MPDKRMLILAKKDYEYKLEEMFLSVYHLDSMQTVQILPIV